MNFFSLFDCCRKETPDEQSERKRIPELYYDHAFIHKPVIRTWLYGLHMALHKAWLSKAVAGVDLCCGPMVHNAAILSSFLESVYLADPIEENCGALSSWLKGESGCLNHSPFLAMVSKIEGLPQSHGITAVESRLREAVRGVFCCNLRHPHIFPGIDSHSAFDVVVVLTRTLETFCSDAESYAAVFRRVNFLLPVGGLLILVGVLGRTASNVTMPPVTKETLETALLTSGFGNMYWILKDLDTRPCSRGVYSYVFVSNKIWEGHPV